MTAPSSPDAAGEPQDAGLLTNRLPTDRVPTDRLGPDCLPVDADWSIEGQLVEASNLVVRLVASGVGPQEVAPRAVFKPTAGERPLSDFPTGTLAHREVATSLVARAAGWTCVPETHWYSGEFGDGSLQRWVGPLLPVEQSHVELIDADEVTDVHLAIAAFDTEDGMVVLTHRDTPTLRRIALLDVITNNADRKGSHLVEVGDDLYGIDHGLTFHVEEKLRTVLWGFAGQPLTDDEAEGLHHLLFQRDSLTASLSEHLRPGEVDAFFTRVDDVVTSGVFPSPPQDRYGLPWPPL